MKYIKRIMFQIYLFQAEKLSMYKYSGIMGWSYLPKARVLYSCGGISIPMEIGTAVEYAQMFNGKVVPNEFISRLQNK